jgi:hypothetical protein
MIARRQFLQSAAAIPALVRGRTEAASGSLEGSLARLIFLDDAASLAVHSMAIPNPVARAIASEAETYFAGAVLQSAASKPAAEMALRAGQAAIGAYAAVEPKTAAARLQWDARLLRELAAREGLTRTGPSKQEIADLFDVLSRRVLIAIHTYIPDEADVEGWMVRLIRLHEAMESYWNAVASAYLREAARADERYDRADAVIRAASALHQGPLDPGAVALALEAQPRCSYGRALKEAQERLQRL